MSAAETVPAPRGPCISEGSQARSVRPSAAKGTARASSDSLPAGTTCVHTPEGQTQSQGRGPGCRPQVGDSLLGEKDVNTQGAAPAPEGPQLLLASARPWPFSPQRGGLPAMLPAPFSRPMQSREGLSPPGSGAQHLGTTSVFLFGPSSASHIPPAPPLGPPSWQLTFTTPDYATSPECVGPF